MKENINQESCAAFQAQLPDLIGSGASFAENSHMKTCEDCRALLADLETIAEAARQLCPIEEPADTLWQRIESAIEHEPDTAGQSRQ